MPYMKRIIVVLLLVILAKTLISQTILPPDAGDGTMHNPYQISTLAHLAWLSESPSSWWLLDPVTFEPIPVYFKQTANIDATETASWNNRRGFKPIGYTIPSGDIVFFGVYDGGNYYIKDLYITPISAESVNAGMFREVRNSTIKNVNLKNIIISGFGITGSIAGRAVNSLIENCYTTGNISSFNEAGGLVGRSFGSTIENSYFFGNVNSSENGGRAGGIVGNATGTSSNFTFIKSSCSAGLVKSSGNMSMTGGITGILDTFSRIENSFTIANIEGIWRTGGIAGAIIQNSVIKNSYVNSAISVSTFSGGIAGWATGSFIENSLYNTTYFNGENIGSGTGNNLINVIGKTESEMTILTTYTEMDWDFSSIWYINEDFNSGFPILINVHNSFYTAVNPPPRNPVSTFLENHVEIRWDIPILETRSATGFEVRRDGVVIVRNLKVTEYKDFEIENSGNYNYEIRAEYIGSAPNSSAVSTSTLALFPPKNISIALNGNFIQLTWEAPTGGAQRYNIYKNDDLSTPFAVVTNALSFNTIITQQGLVYTFRITAVHNIDGIFLESDYYIEATITTPIFNPPRNLDTESLEDENAVLLTWDIPESGNFSQLIEYVIFRDTIGEPIGVVSANTDLSFKDVNVVNGLSYFYSLIAVYDLGTSDFIGKTHLHNVFYRPTNLNVSVGIDHVVVRWSLADHRSGELRSPPPRSGELRSPHPLPKSIFLTGFNIYRNHELIIADHQQTRFDDFTVHNNEDYIYTIVAVYTNPDGVSNHSTPAIANVRFPIQHLNANLFGQQVLLNWSPPAQGGASGYIIYRNEEFIADITTTNYHDIDKTPTGERVYKVIAFYNDDLSDTSPETEITVKVPVLPPPNSPTSEVQGNNVTISWSQPHDMLDFEVLLGYKILRNEEELTESLINELVYHDFDLPDGDYIYKIIAVFEQGESEPVEVTANVAVTSEVFEPVFYTTTLKANYPNPFNPSTMIYFSLAEPGVVNIEIFNIRGQRVRELERKYYLSGEHRIVFDGKDRHGKQLDSGVYFYRMVFADYVSVKRMVMTK